MNDAIIVLNAGSSSLKFSIYQVSDDDLVLAARGQIEGLGTTPHFKVKDRRGIVLADEDVAGTVAGTVAAAGKARFGHTEAFAHLVTWARQNFGGVLAPVAVGHRMAHGGAEFTGPAMITPQVVEKLERLIPLVPLHQPHNLAAVKAVTQLRPDLPQVACFDTSFHQGRAKVTERFGLPDELFKSGIRRWGFHGLSYQFIVKTIRQTMPELIGGRLIVAHLGSGASMCAIRDGKCVDTTMSFSALDGLPMGTRCGSLDPGVILFLLQSQTREQIEAMLYKKSGLLGISGVSNDVRELLASNNPLAAEAIEYFVYRAVREIGSLTAALGGLDALIFTAGIGENSPVIRSRTCERLGWLGLAVDASANERGRGCISPAGQSPSVWVIPTDEERIIAEGTLAVVRAAAPAVAAGRG
jgi:acetate kinase